MTRIISIDGKDTCMHGTSFFEKCIRCYAGEHPIIPCYGEAHLNANIDHCAHCSPFWGELPAFKGMSPQANWTLHVLNQIVSFCFPNMPNEIFSACEELRTYGYVEFEEKEIKSKYSTTYYLVCWITKLGREAVEKAAMSHEL